MDWIAIAEQVFPRMPGLSIMAATPLIRASVCSFFPIDQEKLNPLRRLPWTMRTKAETNASP
jgi:hypothetical protein